MKPAVLFSILLAFVFINCGTAKVPANTNSENLTDLLKSIPGISVIGRGEYATIRVRGISETKGGGEPLFVLDGIEITGGFYSLTTRVRAEEITSVTVLNHRNQTSRYGPAGDNGVIEISTL